MALRSPKTRQRNHPDPTMNKIDLPQVVANTDPERLLTLLKSNGWETVGHRKNIYERLQSRADSGAHSTSVFIPLNRDASDFDLLMQDALEDIKRIAPDVWQRSIKPWLSLTSSDTFSFRKNTSAPDGLIAWNDGSTLIDSARRTLIAGPSHTWNRHAVSRIGSASSRTDTLITFSWASLQQEATLRPHSHP